MAAGKRYSAGAIFLQVVPVFANVQRAIEDEAKNIDRALGDQMEKSGEKAGERAGKAASKKMNEELAKGSGAFERDFHKQIDSINTALNGINVNKLGNSLRSEVAQIKRELASLKDVDITAEADFRRVNASIAELEGRLRGVRDGAKIIFRADIDAALKGFAKIEAAKEAIEDPIEIEVSADFRAAERQMGAFEKSFKKTAEKAASHLSGAVNKESRKLRDELKYLENLRIGVDVSSGQARKEINEIMVELKKLSVESPDIDVKVEAGRAWAELAALEAALKKIDGTDVDIDVDKSSRGLFNLARNGEDASNVFRSFNVIILATTTVGPALVPVLGAIAGGLLALGPAAAVAVAGLSSVAVGFSGIGDVLTALGNQQDQMAISTAQAAKTEESAAERVADARRSASRAVASALERQKDAQESYRDSIDDVREAEEALKEARAAAKNDGQDLDRQVRENALAIDQALLDEFNATVNFNAVMSDGSATNAEQEQARIDMEQAKLRMEELRAEQKELAKEKRKWDKEGVEGTDEVKSAQEQLNDALEAQKDAYENLRDAAEDVDEARADGARMVKDALDAQADSLAAVNAQQNAVDAAMSKLGSAGQEFALFLFSLREAFYAFRDDIQSVLLPAVQEAMEGFFQSDSAKVARDALIGLAESFGRFVKALSVSFQGPAWTGFFQMLADLGPGIQEAYGGAFIKFLEAMASIMTTLAPFALQFARGFERIITAFADWAASEEGQQAFLRFLGWVEGIGPDVVEFLSAFARAAAAIAVALAPWGTVVLEVLTGFFNIVDDMNPKVLASVLTTMVLILAAAQIAYGIMTAVLALKTLSLLAIGPWIAGIVLLVAAIAGLYVMNEDFRNFVNKAWKEISEAFKKAWEDDIKPALEELWDAFSYLWNEVLGPFLAWLAPILLWIIKKIIPLWAKGWAAMIIFIADFVKGAAESFVWLWEKVLKPTWNFIRDAAVWLWKEALKPAFDGIAWAFEKMVDGMVWVWENVLKPAWDFIEDKALPALESAFENTINGIGNLWDGLKALVGAPIKFVLDTIINQGLIDGFNKVAGWVGVEDPLGHIPIPTWMQKYATGGIMPGYTPGRDVHSFVSPTGGRLMLSGGEAVMRPEWTAAMGSDYVNQMNALARQGGVNAIRKSMGGYWMGGILPLPGARVSSHGDQYEHPAFDLNVGSGYDDFGMAVKAWKDGIIAQLNYTGDLSYGRWAILNHADGQSSLYAHLSNFAKIAVGEAVRAGQTIGYVGDLGNTGNPPTSHLHFEIMGGAVNYADTSTEETHRFIPGWLMNIVKDPLGAVKGWVVDPIKDAASGLVNHPAFDIVTRVPLLLAEKATDKLWDIVPGWVKTAAGWAGDAAGWVVGGVKNIGGAAVDAATGLYEGGKDVVGNVGDFLGFKNGGVLPYNGTMKYDNGGFLPPGLTSVVNLTGKPEPVFTADQWAGMGGASDGGTLHYEPHFEGSNLTAEDVAGDLNFTFRRIRRGGKYAGVGDQ